MTTLPARSKRYSVHSLSSDVIPDWLCEGTFNLEELGRPPSYLYSSVHQALEETNVMDGPPAYDRVPPKDEQPALSPAPSESILPSIEDDESMWTEEEGSVWEDAEDEENFFEFEDEVEGQNSDGGSTILNEPISQPQPTTIPGNPSLPPAYSLRHFEDDKTELLYLPQRLGTPDMALKFCLASLEDELVNAPFSVFTDVLYEAAVLGDPRPPSPIYAAPSQRASTLHRRSRSAGSQRCPPLAEEYEGSDEDDEDEIVSPVQAYTPPPLIWDAREQQNYLSRSASRNGLNMLRVHSSMFSKENLAEPSTQDSAAHVASLFLRAPIPVKAQDSITSFPTRPPQRPSGSTGATGVRALLLRSLNFSR